MHRIRVAFSVRFSDDNMYINDYFQLNILLYSVGFGFFAGFFYDMFKILYLIVFKSNKVLFIKDVIYCIISTFLCFAFLLAINDGKIRVYIIIGILLGYISWFISISSLFLRLTTSIFNKLSSFLGIVGLIITFPYRIVILLFKPLAAKLNPISNIFSKKLGNKFKILLKKN